MSNDTVKIPSFDLPPSDLLSETSILAVAKGIAQQLTYAEVVERALLSIPESDMPARRSMQAELFYQTDQYRELRRRYPVVIKEKSIGGILCEVFTPAEGALFEHANRVLINFHGGGFMVGGRTNSHLESAPLAALMGIKVISVDYRMAPEHQHPAAIDDAEAVYLALLDNYAPECLGVYGSSAGALLTAMLMARLIRNKTSVPAAVGLFAAGAFAWRDGDYGHIGTALVEGLHNVKLGSMEENPYFKGVSRTDLEAFPGLDPDFCRHCPPALLLSSTRDYIMSSVVHTETQLKKQGVETELHIWDGLGHVFHYNPWLPESHDMHGVVAAFFRKHLNRS